MSIRLKLTIMFLAIALIPLLFVGALTYNNYKNSMQENHLSQLQNIAAFKTERIETYFARLKADIEIAQGFYNIKKNLPTLTRFAGEPNNPQFLDAQKILNQQLQQMQSILQLSDIMLINPDAKVVYANKSGHNYKDIANSRYAPEQKTFSEGKKGIYFSDVYFDKVEDNRFEMLASGPVNDSNGIFIGVIAFEVDMTSIYNLIQDRTGMGNTGETLLGRKTGNEVIFLNPLRYDPNAALNKKISIGEKFAQPIQEAVHGRKGAGVLVDYSGRKVIAAWQYIPSLNWGLVAKINTEEAFADVTNLRNLVVIIVFILSFLSGVMAFSIARSISEPIKRLSIGAEIIGSGNLDYKVGINLQDEVGQLSRSFDKMTLDLKQTLASRDELNREIIERKQAQEAIHRAAIRAALLSETASQLLQSKHPQKIVNSLCEQVMEYLDCHISINYLVDESIHRLHLNAFGGIPDETADKIEWLDFGQAICGRVAQEGKRIVAENIQESCDSRADLVRSFGIKAYACHPLIAQGSVIGTLSFGTRSRTTFSEDDLALMKTVADEVATAMERIKVQEKLKKTNIQLEQIAEDLTRSNKDLEQFAYVASHDLQEPLRAVAGFVELLNISMKNKISEKEIEYINFAVDGVKRMQSLIRDLLEYSRITTRGKKPEPTDAKACLDRAITNLHASIGETSAKITSDPLPTVRADGFQMTQLFQNLIGNAIKFRGQQQPQIHISATRDTDCWRFSVKDNGIGIEPQYAEKIFLIFQRLHTRQKYPGTGIGLAICKKIVEFHGGKIWVESHSGEGSTFYFTIPDGGELK